MLHALLALVLAAPVQDYTITATAKDTPGDPAGGVKPLITVEGTTNLPDGSRLDINISYDRAVVGRELTYKALLTKDGKFSMEFCLYPARQKNLAGTYPITVLFNPYLQSQDIQQVKEYKAEIKLRIGDAADQERDRAETFERLSGEIKGIVALADEIEAQYAKDKDAGTQFDAAAWGKLMKNITDRALAIESRAHYVPEYKALQVDSIANVDLEKLRDLVIHIGQCAKGALAHPDKPQAAAGLKDAKKVLDRECEKLITLLRPKKDTKETFLALAAEARKTLAQTLEAPANLLPEARKKFYEAILKLNELAPEKQRDALLKAAADARSYFEALKDEKKEDAKKLQEGLDHRLEEIIRAVKEEK